MFFFVGDSKVNAIRFVYYDGRTEISPNPWQLKCRKITYGSSKRPDECYCSNFSKLSRIKLCPAFQKKKKYIYDCVRPCVKALYCFKFNETVHEKWRLPCTPDNRLKNYNSPSYWWLLVDYEMGHSCVVMICLIQIIEEFYVNPVRSHTGTNQNVCLFIMTHCSHNRIILRFYLLIYFRPFYA